MMLTEVCYEAYADEVAAPQLVGLLDEAVSARLYQVLLRDPHLSLVSGVESESIERIGPFE